MDDRQDQHQPEQPNIEFEIIDIDTEKSGETGHRSRWSARFEPMLTYLAHHARLWSAVMILVGCVIIGILLFPDAASFVKPLLPTSATEISMVPVYQIDASPGSDNVTFVMGAQTDGQFVSIAAYDTQSGVLLWHTLPSPGSTITYGRVDNFGSSGVDVYERQADGQLALLAPRTGKVLWTYQLPADLTFTIAYERDGILFFSGSDNAFYAMKNGRLLWRHAGVGGALQIVHGVVYTFNSRQQSYSAFNEENGAHLWSYVISNPTRSSVQPFFPQLTVENAIVYIQTIDNKVLAIQQGHILWTHPLNDTVNLYVDARHLYAIDQGADTFYIFNLLNGKIEHVYTHETGAISVMDSQNNLLYIQVDDGMRAVNANTGKLVWQKFTDVDQPMEIMNGVLYVYPLDGIGPMQALNEKDGALRWSRTMKDQLAVGSNNTVVDFLSSDNRTLSVLRLSDGKILWSKRIR